MNILDIRLVYVTSRILLRTTKVTEYSYETELSGVKLVLTSLKKMAKSEQRETRIYSYVVNIFYISNNDIIT